MKSRNEILATLADEVQSVPTTAWGTVYVRQLKGADFEAFWSILDEQAGARRLAAFVALGLCDESGARTLEPHDAPALLDGPLEPLAAVADAFLAFNGIDLDEKKSSVADAISNTGSPVRSAESPTQLKPLPMFPSGS